MALERIEAHIESAELCLVKYTEIRAGRQQELSCKLMTFLNGIHKRSFA